MTQHLTSQEVAARLQLHLNTVHRWARTGRLPAIRLSRSKRGDWRFPLDQIEKWEKQRLTFELK